MEEAKTLAVELHAVRRRQFRLAARRREAVVRARQCGVTYRRLAAELGVSVGAIQQLVSREQRAQAEREAEQGVSEPPV
jgi:DNA-directed RNA polymerase specialized sigma24 family protein